MLFTVRTTAFSPTDGLRGHFTPETEYPVIAIKDSPAYVSFFIPDNDGVVYSINEKEIHRFFRYIPETTETMDSTEPPKKRGRPRHEEPLDRSE